MSQLKTGADSLASDIGILEGKKFALCINQSSTLANGEFLLDNLLNQGIRPDAIFIFTPEHGLKGLAADGEKVFDSSYRDVKVISLYGANRMPADSVMQLLDLVIYDIQDVGLRFYTYISTLKNIMIACAENNKELWILDRPNPLGGSIVEGPIAEKEFMSYVGSWPIPVRYGLSAGELALMGMGENWIDDVKLTVIPYVGLKREQNFSDWGRTWKPTSPNLPTFSSVEAYVGMCLWEGTMVSEGRGTDHPFLIFGLNDSQFVTIPSLNSDMLLNATVFKPISNRGSKYPKFRNKKCYGYALKTPVPERKMIEIVSRWIEISYQHSPQYKGSFFLQSNDRYYLDLLLGTDSIRKAIIQKNDIGHLFKQWHKAANEFKEKSSKYWLYD